MGASSSVGALAGALLLSLAVVSAARSQSAEDKIQAPEAELTRLKEQQIELKKEATAAAAALPTFSYRPGNGLNIEAADKSWSFRASLESHFRYNFLSGRDQRGRSQGELEGRRFRPYFFYCLNNCLWEIEAALDLDGWGGGTGKNATGDDFGSILQRGAVQFHAEDLHPWLPTVEFGMEVQNAQGGSLARQGSGSTGAQAEYDLHRQQRLQHGPSWQRYCAELGRSTAWRDRHPRSHRQVSNGHVGYRRRRRRLAERMRRSRSWSSIPLPPTSVKSSPRKLPANRPM